jgi:biofilm PGA synthesis lipoprotein PgaB
VRNIYEPLVLNPNSEEWFAQNYQRFLQNYDFTAIEAMPLMENVDEDDADEWMQNLVGNAAATDPKALNRTLFELQSVDWRKEKLGEDRAIPAETLGGQMRFLALHSAMNFGYYPDDFAKNVPDTTVLHKDFSLQDYPYRP